MRTPPADSPRRGGFRRADPCGGTPPGRSPLSVPGLPVAFLGVLIALFLAPATVPGQGLTEGRAFPKITAQLDRTEATLEDQIVLTVAVDGLTADQPGVPELPELPEFEIIQAGRNSTQRELQGELRAFDRFHFILIPLETGRLTIPPIPVHAGGRVYRTEALEIEVGEPAPRAPEQMRVLVEASVSTAEPYVGQQVIYVWRFFQRVEAHDLQLQTPEPDGVTVEPLGKTGPYRTERNGQEFLVQEVRWALFPQVAGRLVIPPLALRCRLPREQRPDQLEPFRRRLQQAFGVQATELRILRTRPIELEVRPLPAAPEGFSGLVGSFRLQARLSRRQLAVGKSATLTLTVAGEGNAQMIPEPRLPEIPGLKIYHDRPSSALDPSTEGLSGRRVFRKDLVPQRPGNLTLPPVRLTYFDPETASYRTARTPELTLQVAPSEEPEDLHLLEASTLGVGKAPVQILAEDAMPPITGPAVLGPRVGVLETLFWTGLLAPPGAFLALLLLRLRSRQAEDPARRSRAEAERELERLVGEERPEVVAAHASRALRGLVGRRLGLEGGALTAVEAARAVAATGAPPEVWVRLEEILSRLEAIRYSTGSDIDLEDLEVETRGLLERLDEVLP